MSVKERKEKLLVTILLAAAMLVTVGVSLSRSQTVALGKAAILPGILCDNSDQAESLPRMHKEHGFDAAQFAYRFLLNLPNDDGDPSCAFYREWPVTVKSQLSVWENLDGFPDRKPRTFFVLQVTIEDRTFYLLTTVGTDKPA